ncbi:hypothetical protein [Loktanella sp. Alg231-35]|jgi:hypothetical protein|uniref:hypothetical protein n=1 Tax=Loktanella sp. Alg231-35 TaxID=1922220 RepID=UPI000D55530E|nr:hypothetical protein [Loktanella sp. Alg231-35]
MTFTKPILFAAFLFTTGCFGDDFAKMTLTDERLASEAGGVLGINPANLTVTERRSSYGSGTYFTVRARNGRVYNCVITGGGPLAFGLTNPPDCARDGQPIQRRGLF